MKDKRGISTIVATILIILITIAAVTIIWVLVLPMINKNLQGEDFAGVDLSISTTGGYTLWDSANNKGCVQVKRGVDEVEIAKIEVIFLIVGNSVKKYFEVGEVPSSNEKRTKCFGPLSQKPDSISVAPVFISGEVGAITAILENIPEGYSEGLPQEDAPGCTQDKDCEDGNECIVDTCSGSACLYSNEPDGTDCSGGTCQEGVCEVFAMPEGLVSWWDFEDDVLDSPDGSGNDGVNHGAVFVDSREGLGKAISLDGSAYVDLGTDASLDITGEITMAVWIKVENDKTAYIISKRDVNSVQYSLAYISGGKIRLVGGTANALDSSGIEIEQWYHVVTTIDGTEGAIYLNGTVNKTGAIGALVSRDIRVAIGARGGPWPTAALHFNGLIDEVMIFDRALSELEIKEIYDAQK